MLSRLEELRLIALCATADSRSAFGKLVVEYQEGLRRYLYSLTLGNASLTDDLAQETFLKAYKSIRAFQGISRFKTWLYKIAYNEYVDWMRKNTVKTVGETAVVLSEGDDRHLITEMRHDISIALDELSSVERSIVLLFYLQDRPIKEISKIMNIPEGTIKVYLLRAKKKMARVIIDNE
ncbi:MAG: RNA polymerase sigma factor [Paramuribaculum sp.]|nr:RNA polymerase sigma factor [Paramuribaculum sp.]